MDWYAPTMIKGVNFVSSMIDRSKNIFDYYGAIEINHQYFIAKETKDSEIIYFMKDKLVTQSNIEYKLGLSKNYFESFFQDEVLHLDEVLFATTKIVIPENIKHLEVEQFCKSKVEYVKLNNIEIIPSFCFRDTNDLKTVILTDKTKFMTYGAFYNSQNLEHINLENVQFLGSHVFYNCPFLKEVKLDSIISIGNMCFTDTQIKNITVPKDALVINPTSQVHINKILPEKNKINFFENDYNFYIELANGYWAYQRNKLSKIKCFHFNTPIDKNDFIVDLNTTFFNTNTIDVLQFDVNVINLKLPSNILEVNTIDDFTYINKLDLNQVEKIGEAFCPVRFDFEHLIADNLQILPKEAFSECYALKTVSFKNLCEIQDYVFDYCPELDTLNFDNIIFPNKPCFNESTIKNLNIENCDCLDAKIGQCYIENFTLTNCNITYRFLKSCYISTLSLNNCEISTDDLNDLIFKQTLNNNALIVDGEYLVEAVIKENKETENLDNIDSFYLE